MLLLVYRNQKILAAPLRGLKFGRFPDDGSMMIVGQHPVGAARVGTDRLTRSRYHPGRELEERGGKDTEIEGRHPRGINIFR